MMWTKVCGLLFAPPCSDNVIYTLLSLALLNIMTACDVT